MGKIILHCDMNNFYASVECALNPELRKYPVAVCGDVEERHGIVLAKNIKAAAHKIKTGEAIWEAKQKCKNLVIVPPNFQEYMKFSKAAREIYSRYTSEIEPFGPDECWLDITGTAKNITEGERVAYRIKEEIKRELGVTVSVGVSFSKIFAKLGSDMKKPDAVTVIPEENYLDVIGDLPVSDILGVGPSTARKLRLYCVETISELAAFSKEMEKKLFGKCGEDLWYCANGMDCAKIISRDSETVDKTVGNGITLPKDLFENEDVWKTVLALSQEVGHRLMLNEKKAKDVSITVKDSAFVTNHWHCHLDGYTSSPYVIANAAFRLFENGYMWQKPVRAVTVRASNLALSDIPVQVSMFDNVKDENKRQLVSETVEKIRDRFGTDSIMNAVVLKAVKKDETGIPF